MDTETVRPPRHSFAHRSTCYPQRIGMRLVFHVDEFSRMLKLAGPAEEIMGSGYRHG